jgi:inner membrane protein
LIKVLESASGWESTNSKVKSQPSAKKTVLLLHMDSVTQIVLGAAVGEAVLGTKEGRKGAFWGAVLGTIPDLDVLVYPFIDPVSQLAAHRAASHSIIVAAIAAPFVGWMLKRLYKKGEAKRRHWILMAFLAFATHIGIDLLTVYGTQVLWPISTFPFSYDSIFIIDPFYTVPLALGLLVSLLVKRKSKLRTVANYVGLIVSSGYLTWGLSAKLLAEGAFRQGYASEQYQVERLMTAPSALNTFLWMGVGLRGDSLSVGLYSVFDRKPPFRFTSVPRNSQLLEGHFEDRAVKRLMWFSKGWYGVEEDSLGLIYSDYRFGRNDGWLMDDGEPVFQFRLVPDSTGVYHTFENVRPEFGDPIGMLKRVAERAKGK